MRTIWHSLVWKEWHEHKWKLVAMATILLAVPTACQILEPESLFESTTAGLIAYVVLAGMFLSMSVAAGENSRGTMAFLQSLPTPMWKPAAAKLGLAAVTVLVPILLVVGFAYGVGQIREWLGDPYRTYIHLLDDSILWRNANWFVARIVMGALAVLSLLVWGAAAGVNRRDEVRAGAIAILVVVSWYFLLFHLYGWTQPIGEPPSGWWYLATLSAGPMGPAIVTDLAQRDLLRISAPPVAFYWTMTAAAVLGHGCLIAWYLMRFGKPAWSLSHSQNPAAAHAPHAAWLAPPRRTKLTAIIWKQARETGPLALIAVVAVVGVATSAHRPGSANEEFHQQLLVYGGMFGFFVVIVAGIGVFFEDLKPGLHTFWRSLPVNVHLWFWVKLLTGLAIIAFALGTPVAFGYWGMLEDPGFRDVDRVPFTPFVLVFLTLYCWSVAAICLVRQPIYAAVFSIASVLLAPVLARWFYVLKRYHGWDEDMMLVIFCIAFSILGTLYRLARRAV